MNINKKNMPRDSFLELSRVSRYESEFDWIKLKQVRRGYKDDGAFGGGTDFKRLRAEGQQGRDDSTQMRNMSRDEIMRTTVVGRRLE